MPYQHSKKLMEKKFGVCVIEHRLSTFGMDVLFLFGPKEAARKFLEYRMPGFDHSNLGFDEYAGVAAGIGSDGVADSEIDFYIIWVDAPGVKRGTRIEPDQFGTISHEVSHFIDRVLERHSIPTGVESTEVRALLQGELVTIFMAGLMGGHERGFYEKNLPESMLRVTKRKEKEMACKTKKKSKKKMSSKKMKK